MVEKNNSVAYVIVAILVLLVLVLGLVPSMTGNTAWGDRVNQRTFDAFESCTATLKYEGLSPINDNVDYTSCNDLCGDMSKTCVVAMHEYTQKTIRHGPVFSTDESNSNSFAHCGMGIKVGEFVTNQYVPETDTTFQAGFTKVSCVCCP